MGPPLARGLGQMALLLPSPLYMGTNVTTETKKFKLIIILVITDVTETALLKEEITNITTIQHK
jgi:hypothetical protein